MKIHDKILNALETRSMPLLEIVEATGEEYTKVYSALQVLGKREKVVYHYGVWELKRETLTQKQIESLRGKEVVVYCEAIDKEKSGRKVKGKLVGIYPHIFTVCHMFNESFSYVDIVTGAIKVKEA